MKDIIEIVLLIIFYGLGISFFIAMHIHQRKENKLYTKYMEKELEIIELRKKQIEEEL